ncbi:MAG: ATPase, T2SS/T4P/T4SS family [Candidatus Falkowbacteria bacterium]|nr:ATPase, T2SS/T4P/T4SS family [Candidatus Falkowbacteria bacterium]
MPGRIITHLCHYANWQGLKNLIIESGPEGTIIRGDELGLSQHEWRLSPKRQQELMADLQEIMALSGKSLGINKYYKIRHRDKEWTFYITALKEGDNQRLIINFIDKKPKLRRLNELGLETDDLNLIKKILKSRQGLIVVSAPFNQGLSSTLYSLLNYLNEEQLSIYTLENFLEQKIKGVNQILIKQPENLHYRKNIERLLKHDSEIIALMEINDEGLLPLALTAAHSGRLVLAGLKTDKAAKVAKQLKDNCSANLIKENLKLIINQRLARRNCPKCLKKHPITKDEISELSHKYKDIAKFLPKFVYEAPGCSYCQNQGEELKVALFELITPTTKKSLLADALLKLKNGLISVEEILKL